MKWTNIVNKEKSLHDIFNKKNLPQSVMIIEMEVERLAESFSREFGKQDLLFE